MTLGGTFQQNALAPIRSAEQMVRRQQVSEMLNGARTDRLAATLASGVRAVARAADVGEPMVNGILPVDHGTELLGRLGVSQQNAVEVWNQHNSSVTGFLQTFVGGIVEGYLGIEGSGVGDLLSQLAGGFARDARLHGPMQELAQLLTEYEQYVIHCAALLDANAELQRAKIASDRRALRGCAIAVLVLVAIGIAVWRYIVRDTSGQSSDTPAATGGLSASATATTAAYGPLLGQWRSDGGEVFKAIAPTGADVKFTVVSAGPSSPYKLGDVAFTIMPSSDGKDLQVEVLLKPGLPAGVRLDTAALSRCTELWTDLRGKPLRAVLDGDRLTVDSVKLDVPVTGLDIQGGRVVGCKKFDPSRAVKVALTLVRSVGP